MNESVSRLVHTSISALVAGLLLLPGLGCGKDSGSSCEGDECGENTAGEGGACEGDECDAAAGAAGTAGVGGVAGDSSDGGAGGRAVSSAGGDPGGVVDLPDDLFEDSNGDGIDGDIEQAVFVSPTGDDTADGTMGAPVRSIGHAVELAALTGKDVYLCDGTYPENVTIEDTAVNLYGGYDCDSDWTRGTGRAEVAPEAGIALTVRNVPSAMVVDRLDFTAPDAPASEPGASSIGVLIVDASDIEIAHSSITAGNATGGAVGATGADSEVVHLSGIEGPSAANVRCSDSNPCTAVVEGAAPGTGYMARCLYSDENTWGGPGGDGGNVAAGGILLDTSDPGEPGGEGQPAGASSGADGASGEDGAHGDAALSEFGSVDETGYVPSNTGADGEPGGTGIAGGGGDGGDSDNFYDDMYQLRTGEYYIGGGGGQGGPGGCGGEGGKGGGAGGASIALLAVRSGLALRRCDLSAADGGGGSRGGEGGEGSAGGAGGPGGWSSSRYELERQQAQFGGTGGPGGRGGTGGPGGGGPSIALVVAGDEPALDSVNLSFVSGGQGGVRGEPEARAANGEAMQMKVIAP